MPVSDPPKLALMATDPSSSPLLPLPKSRKRFRPTDEVSDQACSARTESKIAVIDTLIRGHYEGWIADPTLREIDWYRATVAPSDFVALIESFDDKLRKWMLESLTYDWNGLTGEIVLRNMVPNTVHDVVCAEIAKALDRQLDALKEEEEDEDMKKFLEAIVGPYTTASPLLNQGVKKTGNTLTDDALKSKRQPDACFRFLGRSHQPIVIEVANGQKNEDLEALAMSWMQDTERKTKTVITVGLKYQSPQERYMDYRTPKGTIAVYRADPLSTPTELKWTMDMFTFRDLKSKKPASEASLQLTLADFVPYSEMKDLPEGFEFPNINISAKKLRSILDSGDSQQRDVDRRSRSPDYSPPAKKVPKRQPSQAQPSPAPVNSFGRSIVKPKRYLGQ